MQCKNSGLKTVPVAISLISSAVFLASGFRLEVAPRSWAQGTSNGIATVRIRPLSHKQCPSGGNALRPCVCNKGPTIIRAPWSPNYYFKSVLMDLRPWIWLLVTQTHPSLGCNFRIQAPRCESACTAQGRVWGLTFSLSVWVHTLLKQDIGCGRNWREAAEAGLVWALRWSSFFSCGCQCQQYPWSLYTDRGLIVCGALCWKHLIFTTALGGRFYHYSHFTNEITEAQQFVQDHTAKETCWGRVSAQAVWVPPPPPPVSRLWCLSRHTQEVACMHVGV